MPTDAVKLLIAAHGVEDVSDPTYAARVRASCLDTLGEIGVNDRAAFRFLVDRLKDQSLPFRDRLSIAVNLGRFNNDPVAVIDYLSKWYEAPSNDDDPNQLKEEIRRQKKRLAAAREP